VKLLVSCFMILYNNMYIVHHWWTHDEARYPKSLSHHIHKSFITIIMQYEPKSTEYTAHQNVHTRISPFTINIPIDISNYTFSLQTLIKNGKLKRRYKNCKRPTRKHVISRLNSKTSSFTNHYKARFDGLIFELIQINKLLGIIHKLVKVAYQIPAYENKFIQTGPKYILFTISRHMINNIVSFFFYPFSVIHFFFKQFKGFVKKHHFFFCGWSKTSFFLLPPFFQ
jgi:uncharacterized membrane protein